MNPYVGHPNPMQEGQELFRKGLLSEAALALEAEVLKNPDNAEGWRLLGVTHAENDDDQQVIVPLSLILDAVMFWCSYAESGIKVERKQLELSDITFVLIFFSGSRNKYRYPGKEVWSEYGMDV